MSVAKRGSSPARPGRVLVPLLAVAAAVPLMVLLWLAAGPDEGGVWAHLLETAFSDYLTTTLILMAAVGVVSLAIGVAAAWLVTMCRFPGSVSLQWMLLMPMAMPAYIAAFLYTDLLEYSGPLQGWLRALLDAPPGAHLLPPIRSLGGAVFVMSLVLYPYVYLFARAALLEQSVCMLEAGRTLGCGPWRNFFTLALPLLRPSIAAGLLFVFMETLNDFGTVSYFAIPVFTVGVYNTWLNMNGLEAAARLSLVLLLFVVALLAFEAHLRRRRRYHHMTTRYRRLPCPRLHGWRLAAAWLACATPLALGFFIPFALLVAYAWRHFAVAVADGLFVHTAHSLTLAAAAAATTVAAGTALAWAARPPAGPAFRATLRLAGIGYAIPGAVLAIGVLVAVAYLDDALHMGFAGVFGPHTFPLVSGSVLAILYGLTVRFVAIPQALAGAALSRVTPSMEEAARTLGASPAGVMRAVHLPMVRGSLLTAVLLVFVEGMKELPMTLILRPFDYETLATWVWQRASDEAFAFSAPGALMIALAGLGPVVWVSLTLRGTRPGAAYP